MRMISSLGILKSCTTCVFHKTTVRSSVSTLIFATGFQAIEIEEVFFVRCMSVPRGIAALKARDNFVRSLLRPLLFGRPVLRNVPPDLVTSRGGSVKFFPPSAAVT